MPHLREYRYLPLEPDTIRLISFLPHSTPTNLECALVHHKQIEVQTESNVRNSVTPAHIHGTDESTKRVEPQLLNTSTLDIVEKDSYAALSYCWGDPTPFDDIKINGSTFPVAYNLLHALRDLMHHSVSHHYWIDAICLNQSDVLERNAQVHQMWRIYAGANLVISWLGRPTQDLEAAFETMKDIEPYVISMRQSLRIAREDALGGRRLYAPPEFVQRAAATIFQANYFERVWIVPELLNAHQVLFITGEHSATRDRVQDLQLSTFLSGLNGPKSSLFERGDFYMAQGWYAGQSPQQSLCKALRAYLSPRKKCSDLRDLVFSLFSLPVARQIDPMRRFRPDYTMSIEQVVLRFIAYFDLLSLEHQSCAPVQKTTVFTFEDDYAGQFLRDVKELLGVDAYGLDFQSFLHQNARFDAASILGADSTTALNPFNYGGSILFSILGPGMLVQSEWDWVQKCSKPNA